MTQAEAIDLLNLSVRPATAKPKLKAYTTYKILRHNVVRPATPGALPQGENPDSMRSAYGIPAGGGSGVIAIVDAFHYPEADSDLSTFSTTFKLPPCRENTDDETKGCLQKYPQTAAHKEDVSGVPINCGWAGEAALDLQWAHAIAPKAKLIFVQAKSDSLDDLIAAVTTATDAVKAAGGGQISMSWIGSESNDEINSDKVFESGLLYFASSGDVGGFVGYPAASPRVESVGGTGLLRDATGKLVTEYGWTGSGGGQSSFESLPSYQHNVEHIKGTHRNIPDTAADADPNTGAAVYVTTPVSTCVDKPSSDQYQPGWQVVGGTSLATPIIAAATNVAGRHRTNVSAELTALYANRSDSKRIRDITVMNGTAGGNAIAVGYDNVTGIGSPASTDFDAPIAGSPGH
jgi:subtilase family serine protease